MALDPPVTGSPLVPREHTPVPIDTEGGVGYCGGMLNFFPPYASRNSRRLAYMSVAMVWPGIVATLFVDKGDVAAPYLFAWLTVGLVACFGALGSLANDQRKARS